jgi:hypothetical protein
MINRRRLFGKPYGVLTALGCVLAGLLLFQGAAQAAKGVSINVGSVAVDDVLYPGRSYHLATIAVRNTGTDTDDYTFSFIYAEGQEELRPDASWLVLQPETVTLEPGEQAAIRVGLRLPVKVRPGEYFAFLTAHPVLPAEGAVAVGVAAAARLRFEVVPASFIQGLMFRAGDWFAKNAPWSYLLAGAAALSLLWTVVRRKFAVSVQVRRRKPGPDDRGDSP